MYFLRSNSFFIDIIKKIVCKIIYNNLTFINKKKQAAPLCRRFLDVL